MTKKITFLLLLITCFTTLHAQNTPELLYYKFDGTGTNVPNYASSPPAGTANATIMGGQSQGGNAICNGTLIGTGATSTTDYVNTNWVTELTNLSWTISFRASNVVTGAGANYMFGDLNAGSFRCFAGGVAGANNYTLRGVFADVNVLGAAIPAQTMITFVYDMGLGNIKAYVNGVLNATVSTPPPIISGSGPFKVGAWGSSNGLCSGGLMDEFRLYNHALNAAEVLQLYNPFAVSGFLGPDLSFCENDSIQLNVNWAASNVLWSTGDTTDIIWADTSGTFTVAVSGTCGAGNDTISTTVIPLPTPGFLGSDFTICSGDTVMLTAGMPGDSVIWSTGDTTNSINITAPGTYMATYYPQCGIGMDTVVVDQFPTHGAGFLGADFTMCAGDSAMLIATTTYADTILWSTGATTDTLWIFAPGTYSVSLISPCDTFLDTVIVNPSALVYSNFLIADTTTACDGDSILLSSATPFDTYSWSGGDSLSAIAVTTGGTYILDVTDACGTGSDTVAVNFIELPVASFSHSTSFFTCNFTNTSTGGGTITYSWDFGDGGNSTSMNPTHLYAGNGTYIVTLMVMNECDTSIATDTCIINVAGIKEGLDFSVSIYPNPANDEVFIVGELPSSKEMKISILSQLGQEIIFMNLGNQSGILNQKINLEGLSSGYYFLKIEANERQMMSPLVVRHFD